MCNSKEWEMSNLNSYLAIGNGNCYEKHVKPELDKFQEA